MVHAKVDPASDFIQSAQVLANALGHLDGGEAILVRLPGGFKQHAEAIGSERNGLSPFRRQCGLPHRTCWR